MKAKLHYYFIVLVLLAGFAEATRAAVDFTVTPSAVSNTYSGHISLQITGLTNGETVVVQKFLDLNNSGVVDAGGHLVAAISTDRRRSKCVRRPRNGSD